MASSFHNSPKTGRWQRCVAKRQCPYGGEHRSSAELAQAGGAEVSVDGHGQTQTVSPLIGGTYTVGTAKRKQTFRKDGTKLTPKEARVWRTRIRKLLKVAAKASKRAARRQTKRIIGRAKLRAKWAAQDVAGGFMEALEVALTVPAKEFYAAVEALAEEFADEFEAQMAVFDDLLNPPGADC